MQFLAISAVLFAILGSTRAVAQETPPRLDSNWIASDLARIEQMRGALDARKLTIEGLERALKPCDVREDRAIGFGVRRVFIAVYGGYATTWVRVLGGTRFGEHESRVAGVHIAQTGSPETWDLLEKLLRPAWQRTMRDVEHGLAWERDDAELTLAMRKRTEDALGGRIDADMPSELAPAFQMLTSPFDDVIVGKTFGDDGGPPPGALALKQLVDAQHFDLVRAALRGLNPEGRVYAAHALIARGKLDPKDEAAIAKLRELEVEITTADGCEVEHKQFGAAFAMLD